MAMLSMLRLYTIVTAFTVGGFCVLDPDDRSEICTKTVTMVTMEDATGLIKQFETIIMGNKGGSVIAIHTSIQKQEDNRNKPTPTIELASTTNGEDLTTSNPTATDNSQQSDALATSNAQTLTTTSKDNGTSKPNDTTVRTKPCTIASEDEVTKSTPYDSDGGAPTVTKPSSTTRTDDLTTPKDDSYDSQLSDGEATSNIHTPTTTSKDNATLKPNDITIRSKPRTTASRDEVTKSTPYDSEGGAPNVTKPSSTTRTDELTTSKNDSYSSTKSYSDSTTTDSIDITTSTTPEESVAGMSTTSHRFSATSDWIEVTTVTTAGSPTEFFEDTITTDSVQVTTLTTPAVPDIACNISHFIFPTVGHSDCIQYGGKVMRMVAITTCAWVRPVSGEEPVTGTLFSYCALKGITRETDPCDTVDVKINKKSIKVKFGSRKHFTAINTPIIARSHLCIVKTASSTATYVNGSALHSGTAQYPDPILGNGVLILGHSQYGPIDPAHPAKHKFKDEGFHGEIEGFTLWNRALNGSEIFRMYQSGGCCCPTNAYATFERYNSIVPDHGMTDTWNNACNQNE